VIAGLFDPGGEPTTDPVPALGSGADGLRSGPLRLAWSGSARAHEADGVLAVLDGFLLGSSPRLEDLPAEWRRSGASLTDRLRGAFTLAVWDQSAHTGIVVCDQFSLRPCLMHGDPGGEVRFATHLPALRRLLRSDPAPDPGVIAPWIAPHYLQGHRTMMAGVERVGAARLLELGREGWRRRRYWRLEWRGTIEASWDELVELLRSELRRTIATRLDGDERAGIILSGGVDSSVVLATAMGLEPRPDMRAYSAVFPEWPPADESERIETTTAALGIPGARFAVRPQGALRLALEQLRDTGTVPGGPGGLVERPGVSQAATDGIRVLLDGQGGDEVFGSSPYLLADCLRRARFFDAARLVRRTLPYRRRRSAKAKDAIRLLVDFGLQPGLPRPARALVARASRTQRPPAWLTDRSASALREVHQPWHWLRDERVPRWWAYHEYLLTDHVEGSALGEHIWQRGAPFGIRSGAPLFDVELVEFVLRIPPEVKWQRIDRSLAREAVAGVLPDAVRLNRRKANIGPFYLDLISGPDSAIMRELLLDPSARVREFADGSWIDDNLPRTPTPAEPDWLMWTTVVWRLTTAECWLRWLEDPAFAEEQLARDDLPEVVAQRS
jgi:asparagine synthase (glutamine-hydrolysing)